MKRTIVSSAFVALLLAGVGGEAYAQSNNGPIINNKVTTNQQSTTQQQTTQQTQMTTQQQASRNIRNLNLGPGVSGTTQQQQSSAATPQQGTAKGH